MMMDFNVQFDFRPPSMDKIEREYYVFVLDHTDGDKHAAAEILGVTLKTIYNKLDKWGIGDEYRTNSKRTTKKESYMEETSVHETIHGVEE